MNRDEFEKAYADKYIAGDLSAVSENRDGEGYTDHHIDLCWKVEKLLGYVRRILKHYPRVIQTIESYLEW